MYEKLWNEFIEFYLNPSFGTLKQKEVDLFIFLKLIEVGYLKRDVFDIVSKLKITRQKNKEL